MSRTTKSKPWMATQTTIRIRLKRERDPDWVSALTVSDDKATMFTHPSHTYCDSLYILTIREETLDLSRCPYTYLVARNAITSQYLATNSFRMTWNLQDINKHIRFPWISLPIVDVELSPNIYPRCNWRNMKGRSTSSSIQPTAKWAKSMFVHSDI